MGCAVFFLYDLLCISLCLYMTYVQFRNYAEDKDSSVISFRTFNSEPQDLYPAISFCFFEWPNITGDILDKDKTRASEDKHHHNARTLYVQMLLGQTSMTEEMSRVNFDDLTIRMEDYITSITTSNKNYQAIYRYPASNESTSSLPMVITYQDPG